MYRTTSPCPTATRPYCEFSEISRKAVRYATDVPSHCTVVGEVAGAVRTSDLHTWANAIMHALQLVRRSRFLLCKLILFQRLLFTLIPSICGATTCVCVYFFTLVWGCTPSIWFFRLSVLLRHSSSLDAILQSSNVPRPIAFSNKITFLWHQAQPSKKYFLSIMDSFHMARAKRRLPITNHLECCDSLDDTSYSLLSL